MKNVIVAVIIAIAVIVSAVIVKTSIENAKVVAPFSVYGYEGVLYRLNEVNGGIDVLVPSNEAVLLFPVSQMRINDNMNEQEQANLSKNLRVISQYIQSERVRSLGLAETAAPAK